VRFVVDKRHVSCSSTSVPSSSAYGPKDAQWAHNGPYLPTDTVWHHHGRESTNHQPFCDYITARSNSRWWHISELAAINSNDKFQCYSSYAAVPMLRFLCFGSYVSLPGSVLFTTDSLLYNIHILTVLTDSLYSTVSTISSCPSTIIPVRTVPALLLQHQNFSRYQLTI
jgi:hypothetical protein